MITLSSNAFSVDDQMADVVRYLSDTDEHGRLMATEFVAAFPEYNGLTWSGSWVDTEASGVDVEYTSWVIDWLEAHTPVRWSEGEPWMPEDGDELKEDS